MREFLEDAQAHRNDGYGRAQAHVKQDLPKRFYKQADVSPVESGFAVTLDGRQTKTPGRKPVIVPVAPLAAAIAAEWAAQGERIDPQTMPIQRLINAAIEGGAEQVPALRDEIIKFAGNDLLLYRADSPGSLVKEQERLWDPALAKLARHFGVAFQPTIGIVHQPQPEVTLVKLAGALRDEGLWVLTALVSITALTGSALLALGYWHDLLTPDEVWAAAHVDEDYNSSQWGAIEEHVERQVRRRKEFDAAVRMLDMLAAA